MHACESLKFQPMKLKNWSMGHLLIWLNIEIDVNGVFKERLALTTIKHILRINMVIVMYKVIPLHQFSLSNEETVFIPITGTSSTPDLLRNKI